MEIKTEGNLQEAFAGESQAYRRYVLFAEKADKDGYPQIAKLFRAAADAEAVHARNHFNAMDGVGSTKENLMAASIGEHQEFTSMYPRFIDEAEVERNARALRSFQWANEVEKIHHGYFVAALKTLTEGQQQEEKTYFVCGVCGNTVIGEAPEKCPICGAPAGAFKKVE